MKRRTFLASLLALLATPFLSRQVETREVVTETVTTFPSRWRGAQLYVKRGGKWVPSPPAPAVVKVTRTADGTLLTWKRVGHEWRGSYVVDSEGYELQRPYSKGDLRLAEWAKRAGVS